MAKDTNFDECDLSQYTLLSNDIIDVHKVVLKKLGYVSFPNVLMNDDVLVARINGPCSRQCEHKYSIGYECFCVNQEKLSLIKKD